MALSKVDYNSLNVTAAASKALKWNSTPNGFETGDVAGAMVLLATETASSSDLVTFDSNIDSTYKEYVFKFTDIHPATNTANFTVNFRDGSTAYDATKTTAFFYSYNRENDAANAFQYYDNDIAQGTGVAKLNVGMGGDADQSLSGEMWLFNPSSTTFVKHFIARSNVYEGGNISQVVYVGGYANVTAAIDGVQFSTSSGNLDAGTIKMYGVT